MIRKTTSTSTKWAKTTASPRTIPSSQTTPRWDCHLTSRIRSGLLILCWEVHRKVLPALLWTKWLSRIKITTSPKTNRMSYRKASTTSSINSMKSIRSLGRLKLRFASGVSKNQTSSKRGTIWPSLWSMEVSSKDELEWEFSQTQTRLKKWCWSSIQTLTIPMPFTRIFIIKAPSLIDCKKSSTFLKEFPSTTQKYLTKNLTVYSFMRELNRKSLIMSRSCMRLLQDQKEHQMPNLSASTKTAKASLNL